MATDSFTGSGNLTSPWTVVTGSFNQTGGVCYGNTTAASSYAVNTTDGAIGDQEAQVTMNPRGTGQFIGPAVRGSNSAFTCANVDAGSDGLYLSRWTAGVQTVIAGPLTAPAAGTVIKLRATGSGSGNQLRLYYDGVEQTGAGSPWTVGTNIPDTGYPGITAYSDGTGTGAADWSSTDLTAAPTVNGQTITVTAAFVPGGADNFVETDLFLFDDTSLESSFGGLKVFGGFPSAGGSTVNGQTVTAVASLIAGAVTAAASASGQTLTTNASVIPGAVTAAATVNGQTATANASVIAGAASGGGAATVNGQIVTATASAIAGAVTGAAQVDGQVAAAVASVIVGTVQAAATIAGQLLTVNASVIAGTVTGAADVAGQTATVNASVLAGAASGGGAAAVNGQTVTVTASVIEGLITAAAQVDGQLLTVGASVIAGAAFDGSAVALAQSKPLGVGMGMGL